MFEKELALLPALHLTATPQVILLVITEVLVLSISVSNPRPKSAASADVADLDLSIPFFCKMLFFCIL
jgi:hypothetical protein